MAGTLELSAGLQTLKNMCALHRTVPSLGMDAGHHKSFFFPIAGTFNACNAEPGLVRLFGFEESLSASTTTNKHPRLSTKTFPRDAVIAKQNRNL